MLTEMSQPARGRGTEMREASIDTLGKDKEVTDGDSYRSLNLPSSCRPPSTMLALHQWPPCATLLGRRSSSETSGDQANTKSLGKMVSVIPLYFPRVTIFEGETQATPWRLGKAPTGCL
jgi:hypothetical protein